ncbi:hypothetical protein ASE01_03630 [Nocardioides sp. Root190]|uniref:DUF998 domain-containing protein n=1 Tax=Nocardioides sp. Root190 TaxID=1736488 RepID=UPI0006FDC9EB|nr:DUF998 domain-containing protein [Nocardioides sp. Root190]KRB78377.1 hypothetical protein ASE01_03630 [Nocardioides sp. Root190]
MITPRSIPATTWALQASYVVAEIVIGLRASGGYSFVDHTISELGSTTCRAVDGGAVLCSPWHGAMNAVFVVFGVSLALGAWQLRRVRPPGRAATASLVLWILAGVSSVAVGLTPLDRHPDLHAAVAVWVFGAQPLALVLLGLGLRAAYPRFGGTTVAVGALSLVGSVGFLLLLHSDSGSGAFERLALWPGYVWVCVIAWCSRTRPSAPASGVAPTR